MPGPPIRLLAISLVAAAMTTGCAQLAPPPADPAETALLAGMPPQAAGPAISGSALAAAKQHFRAGNFGNAAEYFEQVVAADRESAEGWLGLAASYDRLRRFDLADRAYAEAALLAGATAAYHNNVGFSHLLRGEPAAAERSFRRALRLAPESVTIRNNLRLLSGRGALAEMRQQTVLGAG